MYLTRMELDISRRDTMRALSAPNLLHGAVEAAFPGPRTRELWRLDRLQGKYYLLILSEREPDLTDAVRKFGAAHEDAGWESRDYSPLLDRAKNGSEWQFRLTANPTKCCRSSAKDRDERGTVHAHSTVQYQQEWLAERAQKHGFSLGEDDFMVVGSKWAVFQKGTERRRVSLLAVTYEGRLTVTDETLFRQALTEGIGRAKAYGMGLLTIVRPTCGGNG